ncbi:unnamed protein product [Lota lota]
MPHRLLSNDGKQTKTPGFFPSMVIQNLCENLLSVAKLLWGGGGEEDDDILTPWSPHHGALLALEHLCLQCPGCCNTIVTEWLVGGVGVLSKGNPSWSSRFYLSINIFHCR